MADEAGFVIAGEFYPTPTAFRLGDPVLITELTGLIFEQFAEAIGDEDRAGDPAVLIGLVGVSIWQKHPRWKRERVVAYVQQLDLSDLTFQGGSEEDEADPPAPAEPGGTSPSSDTTSDVSLDTTADASPPTGLGTLGSDTGSPASLQVA